MNKIQPQPLSLIRISYANKTTRKYSPLKMQNTRHNIIICLFMFLWLLFLFWGENFPFSLCTAKIRKEKSDFFSEIFFFFRSISPHLKLLKFFKRMQHICQKVIIFRHLYKIWKTKTRCFPIAFTLKMTLAKNCLRNGKIFENPKMFSWTRRMPFWQSYRKFLAKSPKIFCSK